jgi:excisionase family DNA binding protein
MERQIQHPKRVLQPLKLTEADYYTPPQAARVLGLSRRRVTQMLKEGYLQGEQLENGRWKIPAVAVTALLNARTKQPPPPPRLRSQQVNKMIEEAKERMALQEHRLERLTDSLSRVFDRLERLEDRMHELGKGLDRQSR